MFFSTITPPNITTKRQHSFLSPINKNRKCGHELKSRQDKPQFQKVGQVRGKKNGMDKKLELSSRKHRNVEHASDIVQHSIPHNIGMQI